MRKHPLRLLAFLASLALITGMAVNVYVTGYDPDASYTNGVECGRLGLPPDCCPYGGPDHARWLKGWQAGRGVRP